MINSIKNRGKIKTKMSSTGLPLSTFFVCYVTSSVISLLINFLPLHPYCFEDNIVIIKLVILWCTFSNIFDKFDTSKFNLICLTFCKLGLLLPFLTGFAICLKFFIDKPSFPPAFVLSWFF